MHTGTPTLAGLDFGKHFLVERAHPEGKPKTGFAPDAWRTYREGEGRLYHTQRSSASLELQRQSRFTCLDLSRRQFISVFMERLPEVINEKAQRDALDGGVGLHQFRYCP